MEIIVFIMFLCVMSDAIETVANMSRALGRVSYEFSILRPFVYFKGSPYNRQ